MELELEWFFCTILSLLGGYLFVSVILKRVNGWYYALTVGKKQFPLPPGCMGWPLLGNSFVFYKAFQSEKPDSIITSLISRYGQTGIYKTHWIGKPCVIVSTPKLCRLVLNDEQNFKLGYPKATLDLFGAKSFFSSYGEEHKCLRNIATASLTGYSNLAIHVHLIEDIVLNFLEESASMDQPVELYKECSKVTFKVITQMFMGSSSRVASMAAINTLFQDVMKGFLAVPIRLPGFAYHGALKARGKLVKILDPVIEERREIWRRKNQQQNMRCGLMDLLVEAKDEEGRKLRNEEIRDLLFQFLLGGHDTTAVAMLWSIIYLTEHTEILQGVKEEHEEIVRRRPSTQQRLSVEEVKQMAYTTKVIDEMLRLTNIAFQVPREAKRDVNVNGYTIPKGWMVLVWLRNIHMDPEIHPNPQEFNPSRFNSKDLKPGSFMPFSSGSRLCPGRDLAKLEVLILLHYFVLNYKLERVNPESPLDFLPFQVPKDNCLAKLTKVI